MMLKALSAILYLAFVSTASDEGPVVQLPDGWIRGNVITGTQDYIAFQGIPYAAPPVGNLRFEEAQPVTPWSDVRNTRTDPKHCASTNYVTEGSVESEDCLYLNVYTPGLNIHSNYSVMVFIHGGAFTQGSGGNDMFGSKSLVLDGGVILVTIQYRLGVYGFISTEDDVLPGNLGLKDQTYALQWVQKNIHLFGGDPNKVTIFGESAGAASVGLHLISEKSKGLFRAAICESGSALIPSTVDPSPKQDAYALAALIDTSFSSNTNTSLELKELLRSASLEDLSRAAEKLEAKNIQNWPVIEPENYPNAFINKRHVDLVGQVSKVPLMIGVNSEESLFFFNTIEKILQAATAFDVDPSKLIPQNFPANPNISVAEMGKAIKNIYLKDNELFTNHFDKVLKLESDQSFVRGSMEHALLHSNSSPVFFYQFSYEGRTGTEFVKIPGAGVIPHAAELPFIFDMEDFKNDKDENNILTQKRMVRMWTNFAKHLNPTPNKDALLQNIIWPIVEPSDFKILNINKTLSVDTDFKKKSFSRWREFFFKYGIPPFATF